MKNSDKDKTITLPLHSMGNTPLLRIRSKKEQEPGIGIFVETPKPLFFTGNYYAFSWQYKTCKFFQGETLDECLKRAEEWAGDLLNFQEESCYSPTGPMIDTCD